MSSGVYPRRRAAIAAGSGLNEVASAYGEASCRGHRISGFARQLHGLLEPLQRKDDTSSQRGKDAVESEGEKPAAGVEIGRVELQPSDDADREKWHRRLPDDDDRVAVGQHCGTR